MTSRLSREIPLLSSATDFVLPAKDYEVVLSVSQNDAFPDKICDLDL